MPCARCRQEAVERMRERRRRFKVRGLCIYCGIKPPEPNHWGCRECLDVKRAKKAADKGAVGYKSPAPSQ